jgi:hypothetical protein
MSGWAWAGITFDGTDDFVSVGTMGNFGTGLDTNYYCVSAYVKSSTTGSAIGINGFLNTGTTTALRLILNLSPTDGSTVSSGKIYMYRRDDSGDVYAGGVNSDTGITNGSWHNIVGCVSNSAMVIYVDGASQTIYNFSPNNADNIANLGFNMWIGGINSRGSMVNPFNGTITELALWSSTSAPSAGDITTLNTHTRGGPLSVSTLNGLSGYWPMDDQSDGSSADGDTLADDSGTGNTGTGDNGANNTGLTWNDDSDLFAGGPHINIIRNATIRNATIN